MSAPSLHIVVALERRVVVFSDASNEGEYLRLLDWIDTHDDLSALVERALEIVEERRAA